MVIINKKRIQIIISALLVGIFTFSLQIANNNQKGEKNKNQNNESVIQTTATPVSGKTVVLDAGHGVPDEGDKMLKLKNKTLQMAIYQRKTLVG